MNKRLLLRHAFYFGIIALYCFVLYHFKIYCPIRHFLHVPCPTCGMTRSFLSLFRLDFGDFFRYHPLTLPIMFAAFYGIHRGSKHFYSKTNDILLIITAVLCFAVYIFRLKFNMIP